MKIQVFDKRKEMGENAARAGGEVLKRVLAEREEANIILATGASQFEVLEALTQESDIDWSRVTGFHLDEYLGMSDTHPASFCGYLKKRFVDKVPLKAFHYINAKDNPETECKRLGELIEDHPIDVAFIGIGENGHIAFNDPPADFETETPYLIVNLDEACRNQQLGEGWFPTLSNVPTQAISMSVKQILKSNTLIVTVPDKRKAEAVRNAVEGNVTPDVPASILQTHEHTTLFLNPGSASLLKK